MARNASKAAVSRRAGRVEQEVQNLILVSCFIGRIRGIPIPNSFLEKISEHAKETYYRVKNRLLKRKLIEVEGAAKVQHVKLTEKGMSALSPILLGAEKEKLEWRDVYNAMKSEAWMFWSPITRMEESDRHDLLQAILLLYSGTTGDNPKQYYRNMLDSIVSDYRNYGRGLTRRLLDRLVKLYVPALKIAEALKRSDWDTNVHEMFERFLSAIMGRIEEICEKAELVSLLGFRRRLTYILYPLTISPMIVVKSRIVIIILFLALLVDLTFIFQLRPSIGSMLIYIFYQLIRGLGVFLIAFLSAGVITVEALDIYRRLSRRKLRASN